MPLVALFLVEQIAFLLVGAVWVQLGWKQWKLSTLRIIFQPSLIHCAPYYKLWTQLLTTA